MPYAPHHKQQTRNRIVRSAARLFNRRGFAEVTVGEIMMVAGLTHGGFYRHFKHFSELADGREPWRIVYPLAEVLLLLTCATIAGCDDFDEIVAWGELHLDFLRRFSPFHHGIPCVRWLQTPSDFAHPTTLN